MASKGTDHPKEEYRGDFLFEAMVGKTFTDITASKLKDEVRFTDSDGVVWLMYHPGDCCESVLIEDISGDLGDLVGSPLLQAEVSSNSDDPSREVYGGDGSYTWTFYKLATAKGYVTIRWYGESNGYYSEAVHFGRAR